MYQIIIGIGCALAVGWVGWVSITLVRNYNNGTSVSELKEAFKEMEGRMTEAIDKVNERQDKFMQTEIQELKSIIKKY